MVLGWDRVESEVGWAGWCWGGIEWRVGWDRVEGEVGWDRVEGEMGWAGWVGVR